MKFEDIEQFPGWGKYSADVDWNYLEWQLKRYQEWYVLDLDPDFQRGHVWSREKQIAYVEYIMRGGRYSRDIIFNCIGWEENNPGPLVLIDGKQRLQAVRLFLSDELPVFGGHYLRDFEWDGKGGRVPQKYMFKFHINNLSTRAEVLKLYLDLNSGGVVHSEEELDRVRDLLRRAQG